MPDLRLPSQSQDIAAPRLVSNYTAWWQRHMCLNNLPKVVTWQRLGQELSSLPLESQANALTITPPGHTYHHVVTKVMSKKQHVYARCQSSAAARRHHCSASNQVAAPASSRWHPTSASRVPLQAADSQPSAGLTRNWIAPTSNHPAPRHRASW